MLYTINNVIIELCIQCLQSSLRAEIRKPNSFEALNRAHFESARTGATSQQNKRANHCYTS